MMAAATQLGVGHAFPLYAEPATGGFARIQGADAVLQAIRTLLLTDPGERVGRPEYGCGLRRFLFQPNTVTTRTLVRQTVQAAIERFEPRVKLEAVEVRPDPTSDVVLYLDLRFRLAGRPGPQTLVFPFYLDRRTA